MKKEIEVNISTGDALTSLASWIFSFVACLLASFHMWAGEWQSAIFWTLWFFNFGPVYKIVTILYQILEQSQKNSRE